MKQITIIFPCRAYVRIGIFTNEFASSLALNTIEGIILEIDENSGYVNWTDLNGKAQPTVSINCVSFIWSFSA